MNWFGIFFSFAVPAAIMAALLTSALMGSRSKRREKASARAARFDWVSLEVGDEIQRKA